MDTSRGVAAIGGVDELSGPIHLGFAVGSGEPVAVPCRNMVVTGQTQESGKTTTLEALVARSGVRALAFVTKRGEGGFSSGQRIRPYFRPRTDWEFVASILEAERREKLKFERSWIIRACRGAKTLEDVHRNVKKGMNESKRGMDRDVYLTLDAYLDNVVPALAKIEFAPSIELGDGLNVMDLAGLRGEVQQLVIASCFQWIYQYGEGVVTVLPEAWEFAPQSRRSPVKLAAIELVRKGSALKNFLWLDSQDIGGVEKELLRSCPLWLLGVQREPNEISRALAAIPAGISKPKAGDIAGLERGQFYACWQRHAIKTYVQPAWMEPDDARRVAIGEIAVFAAPASAVLRERSPPPSPPTPSAQSARVRVRVRAGFAGERRLKALPSEPEDDMSLNEIKSAVHSLAQSVEKLARERMAPSASDPVARGSPIARGNGTIDEEAEEALYQRFKARLIEEAPAVLKLALSRPSIDVEIERPEIELDTKSNEGKVVEMIALGLFDEPMTANAAYKWLKAHRGYSSNSARIYEVCDALVGKVILRKADQGGYQKAEGAEVRIRQAKSK